ncbi:MAG: hypothetical protein AAFN27_05525 [Pseudomonadota bacterium]
MTTKLASVALCAATLIASPAHAQIFEVIHPDVEEGGIEFEILNTIIADSIDAGEERSVHEFAIGYAPFSFWKTTVAFEAATIKEEGAELEAFEWENVFLAPIGSHGDGHDHDHDHGGSFFELGALGLYFAMEVPRDGGISNGGMEIGPIAEFDLGPVETITNLFVEVPFVDDEDPGLAYAISAAVPVYESGGMEVAAGFESFGGVEGLFGDTTPLGDNSFVLGPSVYFGFDAGEGREIEPRLAVLFGMTDGAPDTAISLNFEFKY